MTQRDLTRRQLVGFLGSAALGSLAGCAGIGQRSQQETERPESSTTTTATRTSEWSTPRDTSSKPTTDSPTPGSSTEMTQATDTSSEAPGYKRNHWHGRLFFEIDGDLVDFSQPAYYLKNLQGKRPETVYFHFHDDPENHGPNEWSNEKKTVSFARALNLLPRIKYRSRGDSNALTYKGQTYRDTSSDTSIDIYRGTNSITPQTYTVQHNDDFWVRIGTGQQSGSTASGTRSGTLIIDINNRRLALSSKRYRRAGSNRFGFRDDGNPYMWYSNGEPVTLAEALNTLPDISYQRGRGGASVFTYKRNNAHGGTYRETSDATSILTRQRWTDVNPQSYELQDGDIMWIYIHTTQAPDNEH